MKPVIILRVDDVCAYTTPFELERIYGAWWRAGKPVCFSVIPFSAYRFDSSGVHVAEPLCISENRDLITFLNALIRDGLVEVALHGLHHHFGELVEGDVRVRLEFGLSLLQSAFPDVCIRVLVPPHDYLSVAGLQAAHVLGLTVCSTWAATHGGTRFAHQIGRLRRRFGKPYGVPTPRIIPTDLNLDILSQPPRIRGTAVLVQHYWSVSHELAFFDADIVRYSDILPTCS